MSIGRWFAPLPVDEGGWWGPLCYTQHGEDSDSHNPNVDSTPMNPFCTDSDYFQNFITQTYKMVDDPSTDPLVLWSTQGHTFFVRSTIEFTSVVLPTYFNHSCFSRYSLELSAYHDITDVLDLTFSMDVNEGKLILYEKAERADRIY